MSKHVNTRATKTKVTILWKTNESRNLCMVYSSKKTAFNKNFQAISTLLLIRVFCQTQFVNLRVLMFCIQKEIPFDSDLNRNILRCIFSKFVSRCSETCSLLQMRLMYSIYSMMISHKTVSLESIFYCCFFSFQTPILFFLVL